MPNTISGYSQKSVAWREAREGMHWLRAGDFDIAALLNRG